MAGTLTVKVLTPFGGNVKLKAAIDDSKRETVSMLDGICPPNTMLSTVSKNTETLGFSDEPGTSGAPRRHQSLQPIVPNAEMLVPGPLKEKNALPPLILGPKEMPACVILKVGTLSA